MTFGYYATRFCTNVSLAVDNDEPSDAAPKSLNGWDRWNASNIPYDYGWGKKTRSPFFIGPFPDNDGTQRKRRYPDSHYQVKSHD